MLSRPIATALRATTKQQQQWLSVTATARTRASITARHPLLQRSFASEPTIKRPKPIKVKKSEARRRVEPKAENSVAAASEQNALTEAPQAPPPPSPYMPSEQQQQPTFGQIMKANFFWGIGMALAFSLVGAIFSSMEETSEPGKFAASEVILGHDGGDEDYSVEGK